MGIFGLDMFRPILPLLANLFLVGFALDGAFSLLEELVRASTGSALLVVPRNLIAGVVLVLAPCVFALLALTPRLPASIFVPLLLCEVWLGYGAAPLPLWVASPTARGILLSSVQLAFAALALLAVRRRNGGRGWLIRPDQLAGPLFSPWHSFAFACGTLFVILPAISFYALVSLMTWLQIMTQGFLSFDLRGVTLADRLYVKGDTEIRLVGMMHIGEEDVYRSLVASFPGASTIVLLEGVTDEDGLLALPLSYARVAEGLGLEPQGELESYLGEIAEGEEGKLARPHLRRADVDVRDFAPETIEFIRWSTTIWSADSLLDALTRIREREITSQELVALDRDLIQRRNAHLVAEIRSAIEAYDRVVVPWGALHLPGIERAISAAGFELSRSTQRRFVRWLGIARALVRSGDPGAPAPSAAVGRAAHTGRIAPGPERLSKAPAGIRFTLGRAATPSARARRLPMRGAGARRARGRSAA